MTWIKQLKLHQFRNYELASLDLSPKINIFIGENGQGKTNCLEAIALLISGKSFRTSFLKEMIRKEASFFKVYALFEKQGIEQKLQLHYSSSEKKLLYNSTSYSSFMPLIGLLQGVFFSGFQTALLRGSPSLRRRFLNLQCAQTDPLYMHHLKRYEKALKERNLFLKQKKSQHLDLYENLLAQSAPYLIEKRKRFLIALLPLIQKHLADLTRQQESLEMDYQMHPSLNTLEQMLSDHYLKLYEKMRSKDLFVGYTQEGPHKDDLIFKLKGLDVKKFASDGQIQSLVSALYLAEYDRLTQETYEPALFCVDDISQNLDAKRLHRLYQKLDQIGQVFITTPEKPDFAFQSEVAYFKVHQGTIQAL